MYIKVNVWFVVFAAALVGATVGVMTDGREAMAQSEGKASHMIALTGAVNGSEQAVYLVDTREQILIVYEYGLGKAGLDLSAARSFKSDKLLREFDVRQTGGLSPSVAQVAKMVK